MWGKVCYWPLRPLCVPSSLSLSLFCILCGHSSSLSLPLPWATLHSCSVMRESTTPSLQSSSTHPRLPSRTCFMTQAVSSKVVHVVVGPPSGVCVCVCIWTCVDACVLYLFSTAWNNVATASGDVLVATMEELFETHTPCPSPIPPSVSYSVKALVFVFVLYFFLASWTYGLMVSSGLFVPSLLVGATWGRIVGNVINSFDCVPGYVSQE